MRTGVTVGGLVAAAALGSGAYARSLSPVLGRTQTSACRRVRE